MDDTYQTYLNRLARQTLPETYKSQLQHIHKSPKFKLLSDGTYQAVKFPGYSVVTPPWEDDSANAEFYASLKELQQQLLQQIEPGLMVAVPPESFHFTLADLIWDSAYRDAESKNPAFEEQLRKCIGDSFVKYQNSLSSNNPISWSLIGLMVMPRALAVCLAPTDEYSYQQILKLRRSIYQNPGLIALGIEQQYHFTAHVTLGYFGQIPDGLKRDELRETLLKLNRQGLPAEPLTIAVNEAQLRKFDDMMHYYREPDWPVFQF
ncbi:MAG: DUF1868 domain-containing protein [Coleofasciculaceae cyanobacterium]